MQKSQKQIKSLENKDAIDSYFECITSCSLNGDDVKCLAHCVEVHLKQEG